MKFTCKLYSTLVRDNWSGDFFCNLNLHSRGEFAKCSFSMQFECSWLNCLSHPGREIQTSLVSCQACYGTERTTYGFLKLLSLFSSPGLVAKRHPWRLKRLLDARNGIEGLVWSEQWNKKIHKWTHSLPYMKSDRWSFQLSIVKSQQSN